MGKAFIDGTLDLRDTLTRLDFPVAGAAYLNLFGVSSSLTARNLAFGSVAAPQIVGTPTVNASSVRLTNGTNYIDTGVAQPADFTMLAVAKPVTDATNLLAVMGNLGGTTNGAGLFYQPVTAGDDRWRMSMAVTTTGGNSVLSQTAQIAVADMPHLILASYDDDSRAKTLSDLTNSTTQSDSSATDPAAPAQNLLIGSGYNTNYQGDIDIYFAGIWPFAFTSAQTTAAHAWVTAYLADRFSLTV